MIRRIFKFCTKVLEISEFVFTLCVCRCWTMYFVWPVPLLRCISMFMNDTFLEKRITGQSKWKELIWFTAKCIRHRKKKISYHVQFWLPSVDLDWALEIFDKENFNWNWQLKFEFRWMQVVLCLVSKRHIAEIFSFSDCQHVLFFICYFIYHT